NKLYQTPVANNCQLGNETHWVTVSNITNPKLFTVTDPQLGNPDITNSVPNEASVTLEPGETAYITLRVVNPTPAQTPFNPLTAITPVTIPQAVNTETVLLITGQTTALGSNSVTIQVAYSAVPPNTATKTFSIPINLAFQKNVQGIINDGVVGQSYFAFPFTTTGGTSPSTWAAANLPPGLS